MKSGINKNKEKDFYELKEVALNDLKPIVKNNMTERILFYSFKIPD